MKPIHSIKHVFFDLDHTLWDFEKNSKLEILDIWKNYNLHQKGVSLPDEFLKVYERINSICWAKYRANELNKEDLKFIRFYETLNYYGIDDMKMAKQMGITYLENSPKRTCLISGTIETLDYLAQKYKLHIITNGFTEVQLIKLNNCGLTNYFETIVTSEQVGCTKPNPKIFNFALDKANALNIESVYVGDNFKVDIEGAVHAGMNALFYNPIKEKYDLEILGDITSLSQIKSIL